MVKGKKWLIYCAIVLQACGGGSSSNTEKENKMVDLSTFTNPEPNIPTECYTDTGIFRTGKAYANPCYVCHTQANTPYINEITDYELTFDYSFPEKILKIGNPWLNAIRPDLTIANIPIPTDSEIQEYIRQDNWNKAYTNRGIGNMKYFPDIPPIYKYENGNYSLINIDSEGFIQDTGWRAFKWKPFPGFFPTNGRIDSTFIRLDRPFREKRGSFDKTTYKKNLAIVECAVKGVSPGDLCSDTEVGDFIMPDHYEGDASSVPVINYQYPPGTEFAHPIYYLDPQNTISFKSLRIKEMRYMKKLAYSESRKEQEEEEESFFWDNGVFFNLSKNWLMSAYIEDKNGDLRPQTAEESKFCISCHGGIGGTVDGTFAYWRKVPGANGWMDQDYNLTSKSLKDWNYKTFEGNIGPQLERIMALVKGEYQLYFSMTDGGDHFRSNEEIRYNISKDPNKISFILSPTDNIITNPNLINYLDNNNFIKPELFLPSKDRAYGIDKQYRRIVKAQAFKYGRDVFDRAFGISSGGNSLEKLDTVKGTGVKEEGIWAIIKTFLNIK